MKPEPGEPGRDDGIIVASYGRRHLVELPDSTLLDCVTRGRRGQLACGDRVSVAQTGPGQGVIEAVQRRATLLYRSDPRRQKLIAANVSQVVVVMAALPPMNEDLLDRCLVAAESGTMAVSIALNKADLPESAAALGALEAYRALGYRVDPLSAKHDVAPLRSRLEGHTSVLVGQSGVGKSTIINRLIPGAGARTDSISHALRSGRHTTTHARLYHLDQASRIIDSPGMQEFGLHHLTIEDTAHAFIEFRPWLGQCRFRDCQHRVEPDCALTAARDRGEISARRLALYRRLAEELLRATRREPPDPSSRIRARR